MKVPLRERFQTQQIHASEADPLIRLAALYRLAQRPDDAQVTRELRRALASLDGQPTWDAESDELVFGLHAAVQLAQRNVFDGVRWILDQAARPAPAVRALAETALRNCTQFPFAVVLAQAFDMGNPEAREAAADLMARSEDDLFAASLEPEAEQQAALVALQNDLGALTTLPLRPNRHLALGFVLTRAELRDRGYLYTGFIGVERPDQVPLIAPYELADILNRDDRHAQNRILRNLGWVTYRALVVYSTEEQLETLVVYVLPFAPMRQDETDAAVERLTREAEGAQLAVVMQIQRQPDGGGGYRLFTSSGRALWQKHRVDQQQLGDCFLLHERNDWPLWTPFRVKPEDRGSILERFFSATPTAFGVTLEMVERQDALNARIVRAVDGEERLRRVSQPLPPGTLAFWETAEDGKVFQSLIPDQRIEGGCPHCFGARYRLCPQCGGEARVTCPACGGSQRVICWECGGSGQDECEKCDGQGRRTVICNSCNGEGSRTVECNTCHGTGTYTGQCRTCNGTGRYADSGRICKACGGAGSFSAPCKRCQGQGTVTLDCRQCNATGQRTFDCQYCKGTGLWDCGKCHGTGHVHCRCDRGRVTCPTCEGRRVVLCECGGMQRGRIVPALTVAEAL